MVRQLTAVLDPTINITSSDPLTWVHVSFGFPPLT